MMKSIKKAAIVVCATTLAVVGTAAQALADTSWTY